MYRPDSKLIPALRGMAAASLLVALAATAQDAPPPEPAAATSTQTTAPPAWQPEQLQTSRAVAEAFPEPEVNWLEVDGQAVLAPYRTALNAKKMTLLSLVNRPAEMLQDNVMRTLYLSMPDYGWPTMLLLLPPYMPGESDPSLDQSAAARLAAAINFAIEQESVALTLLADTETAPQAIAASIAQRDNVSGLILWHVDADKLDANLLQQLVESRTSVLDIVAEPMDLRARNDRRRLFELAGFGEDYQLIIAPGDPPAHAVKRMRRWLGNSFEVN